jgi:hypothetical protein
MRLPNDHRTDDGHAADASDRAIVDRLDELASSDASAAGPMLEQRVIAGVAGVFAPPPIAIERAIAIEPSQRPWHRRTAFRVPFTLAAGLALVASVGVLAWPNGRAGPGATDPVVPTLMNVAMVEQRINGLVALTGGAGDAAHGSFEDRVASIELWADALASDTEQIWLGSDLADPAWYESGWSDLYHREGAM